MAKDIFLYTDFRKFLHDRLEELKSTRIKRFSYRAIAEAAGFNSPGYLTQVIQGKSKLSGRLIVPIASALELGKLQSRYFALLVQYNQAGSLQEKKACFAKMAAYKKGRAKTVDPDEFLLYDKWYYSAIRAVLHFFPFAGDYQQLARMLHPPITPAEARKAVEVLEKLGYVANVDGVYEVTVRHITTGPGAESVLINNFVVNTLDIAKDALDRFPKDKRGFSALTLSVSEQGYRTIRTRLDEVRAELIDIVKRDTHPDRVYQVNTQIFPLTKLPEEASQ